MTVDGGPSAPRRLTSRMRVLMSATMRRTTSSRDARGDRFTSLLQFLAHRQRRRQVAQPLATKLGLQPPVLVALDVAAPGCDAVERLALARQVLELAAFHPGANLLFDPRLPGRARRPARLAAEDDGDRVRLDRCRPSRPSRPARPAVPVCDALIAGGRPRQLVGLATSAS